MDALERLTRELEDRYTVERELGAGGMATVYLARDLKHNRRVALKVLHPELSAVLGPERFLKEIELTANLQHPHILALFDSGAADGLLYYVMPYVEGESLRSRLEREHQLPVAEAIRIAGDVADALDYAHRQGVIHRDIKPENILLHEGRAQVADFGIALAVSAAGGERMTQTGLSLGTPQYMAPEQAMGERGVDARADVYALGAVVYEMVAGEPPFAASTAPAVLAKVLTERPARLRTHRPQAPEHVELALERALEKLPADRWQSAKELAEALEGRGPVLPRARADVREPGGTSPVPSLSWKQQARQPVTLAIGVLALLFAGGLVFAVTLRPAAPDGPAVRFQIVPSAEEGVLRDAGGVPPFAVDPRGEAYVYLAAPASIPAEDAGLHLRRVNEVAGRSIPGSEGGRAPTFSLDGRWLAFMSRGELRRVNVEGGAPLLVSRVPLVSSGLAWAGETIVVGAFATGGLQRVSANGGVLEPLTLPEQGTHRHPVALPDGETILFSAVTGGGTRVGVASLGSGEHTVLELNGMPIGMVDGLLVYHDGAGSLFGVPFDPQRQRIDGGPIPLLTGVAWGDVGGIAPKAALSASGTLLFFRDHTGELVERQLVSVSLEGEVRTLTPLRGSFFEARYAPDGRRIALTMPNAVGVAELWIHDLLSGTLQPLARGVDSRRPEWSPDGRHLLFWSTREGADVWRQPVDGSGPAERLQIGAFGLLAPDGNTLVFRGSGEMNHPNNLWMRALDGDTAVRPVAVSEAYEHNNPAISPDGRWITFPSNESGIWEIYLQPFPGPGPRHLVSVNGGDHAVWAPDGRSLYYSRGQEMYEAVIRTGPVFAVTRRRLFELPGLPYDTRYRRWDLAPDGSHFLMPWSGDEAAPAPEAVMIHNWVADVRARLRAGRSEP